MPRGEGVNGFLHNVKKLIPRLSVIPPKVFSDNQKAKKKGKDEKKANHLVFLCHLDQIGQSLN